MNKLRHLTKAYNREARVSPPVNAMSAPSEGEASDVICARVLSITKTNEPSPDLVLRVSIPGQALPVNAAVAAACLLQPQTGDLVLLCRLPPPLAEAADSAWWVLSVLRRSHPAALATLAVPGASALKLQAHKLHLVAQDIELDAPQTTVNAKVLRLVASTAHIVAQRLTQIARIFHSTADTVTEHCRTRVAIVDELHSTHAGTELLESKDALMIKGGHVLVDAKETVRMDGQHILMG